MKRVSPLAIVLIVAILTTIGWLIGSVYANQGTYRLVQKGQFLRMKRVATSILLYQEDNDGMYPHRFSTNAEIMEILAPKLKVNNFLHERTDTLDELFASTNPQGGEILPNAKLEGVSATGIPRPELTVMFYETKDWPNGRRCYAFADGHAGTYDAERAQDFEYGPFELEAERGDTNEPADGPQEPDRP